MTLRTDMAGEIFGRLATEERVLEQIVEAPTSLSNANLKARAYRLLPVGSFLLMFRRIIEFLFIIQNRKMNHDLAKRLKYG